MTECGDDEISREIGRRIRRARQEQGLTLAQVGGSELSRSFLCAVELGRSRISLRALEIVARRLGLSVSHFFVGDIQANQEHSPRCGSTDTSTVRLLLRHGDGTDVEVTIHGGHGEWEIQTVDDSSASELR